MNPCPDIMVPKTLYQHIGFSKVIKELQKLNDFAHAYWHK